MSVSSPDRCPRVYLLANQLEIPIVIIEAIPSVQARLPIPLRAHKTDLNLERISSGSPVTHQEPGRLEILRCTLRAC